MNRKVFCIGMNKTGTTSLERFMQVHGFDCGNQVRGEMLMKAYSKNDFDPIIEFCHTAEFFQDLPFSAPRTFKEIAKAFPRSRFILTVRDSPEQWYQSLVSFHESVFGKPLDKKKLQHADYRYPGFAWEANRALYNSPEDNPYDKESLIQTYQSHIHEVRIYFEGSENFLELNVGSAHAVSKLSAFLDLVPQVREMPWMNKTLDR